MPFANISELYLNLRRPAVMGVLNVTPDSFSDRGQFSNIDNAVAHARDMIADGADIIDVGGESTRPGAAQITPEQELERVLPVIHAIRQESDIPLSIDTSQPLVITETAKAGVNMVNDPRSLKLPGALKAVADRKLPVIMYHMLGDPTVMKYSNTENQVNKNLPDPEYNNVVEDIMRFFVERIAVCEEAGIARENITIDPGFCFGKTYRHNLQLLANLSRFHELGLPICVGLSRKSFVGEMTGRDVDDRLYGTVATSVLAAQHNVAIIRVHDVRPTLDALRVVQAVKSEGAIA